MVSTLRVRRHQERTVGDGLDHEADVGVRATHRAGTRDGGGGHPNVRVRRVGHAAQQWDLSTPIGHTQLTPIPLSP